MKKSLKIVLGVSVLIVVCIVVDLICIFNINRPIFAIKDNSDSECVIYRGLIYDTYNYEEYPVPQIKFKNNKPDYSIDDIEKEYEDVEKELISSDEAMEVLRRYDYTKLDLPVEVSQYEIVLFEEERINEIDCYTMGAFVKLEGRNQNMGSFAVSKDGKKVFKIVDGSYQEAK